MVEIELGAVLLDLLILYLVRVLGVVYSLFTGILVLVVRGGLAQHLVRHQCDRGLVVVDALLRRLRVRLMHEGVLLVAFLDIAHFLARRVRVVHVDADAAIEWRAQLLTVWRRLRGLSLPCFCPCDIVGHGAAVARASLMLAHARV